MESKQYLAPSIIMVTPKLVSAPAVDATMMAPINIWAIPSKNTVSRFQKDTFFFFITAFGNNISPSAWSLSRASLFSV